MKTHIHRAYVWRPVKLTGQTDFRPMEHGWHGFFLPRRQNISSFVKDCFFPQHCNNEALESDVRLAFDHVQVLEWVLRNNCSCYLVFFLHFWTILTIPRYTRSLKLWNEVPSNKLQTSLPQKQVTKDKS